jgi:hypothetical protein
MRHFLLLILLLALPVSVRAAASVDVAQGPSAPKIAAGLAAHRAVYNLTLDHARGDVVAAGGTMAYEVTDACDGWAVRQRLQMTLNNRDGQPIQMVSDYTTFETKDGRQLSFRMRQTTEQAVTEQVEGTAKLDHPGGTGTVHYTVPKDFTMALPPGTLFPMWHTATLIAAAETGKKFISMPLFDGTGAEGAQDSSVAIANWGKAKPTRFPILTELPSGRVHVAFFSRGKNTGQPDYEVGMRYWENGVADDLMMDFGDFVMAGKLGEFTLQPSHC